MRDFPHLKDTRFPNFDTVDPYKFQNEFDYTRWVPNTRIHLCNVLWDMDYENVVKFEDNDARDAWFDSIDEHVEVITTDMRVVPSEYVKLPIPYDVMARYNYIWIELPMATSEDTPLDYETGDGIRRWHFFVQSTRYLAPNTTEVSLALDVWTNFVNDMELNECILERGHAPVSVTDTDAYLANPISNSEYLLADDVNFGEAEITRNSTLIPFGNGEKWIVMFSTVKPTDSAFASLGTVTSGGQGYQRPLTYSNVAGRQGYQLQVNNFGIGSGYNYETQNTPVFQGGNSGNDYVPNNLYAYAIKATYAYGTGNFFQTCAATCPAFLNTIQGICMVDREMLNLGLGYVSFLGFQLYKALGDRTVRSMIRLNKSMFSYPERYQRFAKLYTHPYAVLELTDNDGYVVEVKCETLSDNVAMTAQTSLAFPFLNLRAFFSGIGGVGSDSYQWVNLKDETSASSLPKGDWRRVCFDFDIPTYALYMDAATMWNLNNYNSRVKSAAENALVAYHVTTRDANTAHENALDTNQAGYENAQVTRDMQHTNAVNSANEVAANMSNSNAVTSDNAQNDINTDVRKVAENISKNKLVNADAIASAAEILSLSIGNNTQQVRQGNAISQHTTQTQNETAIATNSVTQANNVKTAPMQGAYSGAMSGIGTGASIGGAIGNGDAKGTAVGAVIGGVAGGVAGWFLQGAIANMDAEAATTNVTITTNAAQSITDATVIYNLTKLDLDNASAYNNQTRGDNSKNHSVVYNNASLDTVSQWQRNLLSQNTNNAIAASDQNRDNTVEAILANADNTSNAADHNAVVTKNMLDSNSTYTRENAILDNKERLEAAQNTAQNALNDARNGSPVQLTAASGDYGRFAYRDMGIQVRVKTQSDSAIAQAGDTFARYGYALNRYWDMAGGLNLMEHFTYWKMASVWVNDVRASNATNEMAIKGILTSGVTVWNNPDEIGRVSIYGN